MTRLDAMKRVLAYAEFRYDAIFDDGEAGLTTAMHIVEQMIAEVEATPNVVQHATDVLHEAGCVPLIWGEAADVLEAESEDKGVQYSEEELRGASVRLAKAWDAALSDELNAMVEETLQVAIATA